MRRNAVRDAVSLSAVCVAMLLTLASEAQELTFTRFAGTTGGPGSVDATGVHARFNEPYAIVAGPDGSVYVTDSASGTVRRISPSGDVTTVAGRPGADGAFDGVGHDGHMSSPRGIARDASGNLYVSNWGTSVIRKITPAGAVTTYVGRPYQHGFTNGPPSVATFNHPAGLAFDSSGNLYVADQQNHMIRKITPGGGVQSFAGAPGVEGYANGTGINARFRYPTGLAFGPDGTLYVADRGNHVIRKIDAFGTVSLLAGEPLVPGDDDGSGVFANFRSPEGLTVDASGAIYVADTANSVIRKVTSTGVVTTFAGTGVAGNSDGELWNARFGQPSGITVAPGGSIYVSDRGTHAIRRVAELFVTTHAGAPPEAGLVNGASASARFAGPTGVATDATGNVYVADRDNFVIRMITPTGSVSTVAGAGVPGHVNGPALDARFRSPTSLTVHGSAVFITDEWASHTIRKLVTGTSTVLTIAGTDLSPGSEDGPGTTARFDEPSDAATDASGNIYITDSDNHTIRKIANDGTVSTFAGLAGVSGTTDATGSSARFNDPYSIVRVGSNLFVVDRGNHSIRKITLDGAVVTTFAGTTGVIGFEDGVGEAAGFYAPHGIGADTAGNLYVSEPVRYRIRKITPARVVTTVAGSSAFERPAAEEGTSSVARFMTPAGVAGDAAGSIFIADTAANRIWKGSPAHPAKATIDAPTGPRFVPRQLGSTAAATSYQWSIVRRPNGSSATLSNPSDDNPTFTPDVHDRYTFRLDASTGSSRSITLVDFDAQCSINIDTTSLPQPVVGEAYSQTITASGGTAPYAFGITGGSMPPGLALLDYGLVWGTPTVRTSASITVVAMDANGCKGTRTYPFDVAPLPAPSSLVATAGSGGVALTWNGVATASGYAVYRASGVSSETLIATPGDTPWTDPSPPPNTTIAYRVRALDAEGYSSPPSNRDLATTVAFTDPSITSAPLTIKAAHVEELRHAVQQARYAAGLDYFPWTNPGSIDGVSMKATHITELRTALNQARVALGISAITFTDASLAGVVAKKIHVTQLRSGVQ